MSSSWSRPHDTKGALCALAMAAALVATGAPRASASSQDPATLAVATSSGTDDAATLHRVRYCEILTVTFAPGGGATAEVWNTMGLNDCPQEAWDAIDLEAAKAQTGAAVAVANGPRYWVLDRIVPGALVGSLEVQTFTGLELRSIALVDLPTISPETLSQQPYVEVSVQRDTVFTFLAGRRVYELIAPDGSIYIMQSYSQQVDADLTIRGLQKLGRRIDLPKGWTFRTRVLKRDLDVEDLEGIATVIQDDLRNTYQLRARG